jgi:hypothetical protein
VKHKEKADARTKPLTGRRRSTSGPRRRRLMLIGEIYHNFSMKFDKSRSWQVLLAFNILAVMHHYQAVLA